MHYGLVESEPAVCAWCQGGASNRQLQGGAIQTLFTGGAMIRRGYDEVRARTGGIHRRVMSGHRVLRDLHLRESGGLPRLLRDDRKREQSNASGKRLRESPPLQCSRQRWRCWCVINRACVRQEMGGVTKGRVRGRRGKSDLSGSP